MTIDPRACALTGTKPLSVSQETDGLRLSGGQPTVGRKTFKKPDRRKSRRIKDPVLIFLYRDRLGTKRARPLDLGLDGIGIETKSALKTNEKTQIAIIIGECQVSALGTVVYTQREESGRFRSGIRFTEISDRNRGIIKLYLEKTHPLRRSGRG